MFEVQLSPRYRVRCTFEHHPNESPPGTDCVLELLNQYNIVIDVATGMSFVARRPDIHGRLQPIDEFSRPVGREISLGRAIQKLVPRRFVGVRRKIWDAYFRACKEDPRPEVVR